MPRPKKCKQVCYKPAYDRYGPLNPTPDEKEITMSVEEFETIRLIDLEGLMQEECAERMNVARTTVQRIYNDARKKIARLLVDGFSLRINGGDYQLNESRECEYRCQFCPKIAKQGHCKLT